jgi:hypothetical protein
VLSGRGIYDELVTRPEESYRLWCVVVCDLEISERGAPGPLGGCCPPKKKIVTITVYMTHETFLLRCPGFRKSLQANTRLLYRFLPNPFKFSEQGQPCRPFDGI